MLLTDSRISTARTASTCWGVRARQRPRQASRRQSFPRMPARRGACCRQGSISAGIRRPFATKGGRDTCTVFAMTAAIEAAYKRLYGLELDLSEQYLQHVQKIQWLNGMAMLPAAEVQSETNGGGNLTWHVGVLQRYGIPLESQLPYVGAANYQDTNQAGDIPSGLDSATLTQKALDDFILSEGRNDLIPEALNHAVLPQTALAGADIARSR